MLTVLSAIIGFLSSGLPNILSYFQDGRDKKHELNLMDKQIEFQKLNLGSQVQAIDINAQIEQLKSIYASQETGVKWVDSFNAIIRPLFSLSFLALFIAAKLPIIYMQFQLYEMAQIMPGLWTKTDSAMMGSIIGFFFGGRRFYKVTGK